MKPIYSSFRRVLPIIFFLLITVSRLSAQLPTGFVSNLVQNGYTAPIGVVFSGNGNSMFTWEKSGHVYISQWNGSSYVKQVTPILDIEEEVGDWRDFGLLSFCLDPDFDLNGLVYLYYVVDRHYLLYAGTPQYNAGTNDYFKATIGRVTRYHINLGATVTTDYSSRKILIGESITTGIPLLHESHMGGTLIFGRDKTLLLSVGDGGSYNSTDVGNASETYYQQALADGIIRSQENVGALRAQMVNSHSGKVLRFDPNTGDGIASNPFFDAANPRSPKSRVWSMGFRNPFRMSLQPNTGSTNPADANPGTILLGDVGWNTWEEIEIINTGGLNFGWPLYEGEVAQSSYMAANTMNQDEGQLFKNLCLQPTSFTVNPIVTNRRLTHYRPAVAWKHATNDARVASFSGTTPTDPQVGATGSPTTGQMFAGNCAIGGVYYTGTGFGAAYQNTYFFGDYGTNIIKVANLNTGPPWISNISNFAPENFTNGIVDMEQNPLDNSIFYVNINTGEIMRISLGGNSPPVAALSSNKTFGPSPLTVNFSSAGSVDPDGGTLQYLWDFGDGTTSTLANPAHTFSGVGILSFTVTLTVTDLSAMSGSKSMLVSINNTPPVAKINNPINNSTYSILSATQVPLTATVTDNETTTGMQYAWEVILRHNNHEHREPVVTETNPTVQISPVGCDGETYYYLIELTVTDNGGLTSTDSVKIYPDCSMAGLAITNLTATPQNNNVLLSWTNPSGTFDEIMVAAQPSTGFLTNPAGVNYIADPDFTGTGTAFEQGKIVYKGNGQSVTVTNLNSGTTYYFRVFTRIGNSWTGGVETSALIQTNLTGFGSASSATVNLSTEGITDWAHWSGYDHKSTGGSKISNYVVVGSGAVSNYIDDPRTCTWSDGTPVASGSNMNGIYISGIGNGFQVTAPADLTSRTLKVYVGGWSSGGTLTAQLSDGSSADYVNSSFSGTGQYDAVYTLTYKAASAGKLLTVKWVQSSGTGNVTLQAATLVQSGAVVNVTGVTVNPTSATLAINSTQQLTATIAPANASNQNITWSSSNSAVATVSAGGLVTAIAAGGATITVTTQDGNKTATCIVTVSQALPGSLTGSGLTSSATVNLSTEGVADWAHWSGYDHKSTGGSKISNYVVVGSGTVSNYIDDPRTCTWSDGTPAVSGSNKNGIYIAGTGKGFQVTAPADLTSRTLKVYAGGWSSGGTLTAQLSDGSSANYVNSSFSGTGQYDAVYTLTYKAASAGKLLTVKWVQSSGTGNVTLQAATLVQSGAVVNVTGVTVNPTSATLAINSTQQLTATIAPANASNQNVTWSSSNSAVATVSAGGLVTAIAAGTATITVTTQDGNKTATCNVTSTPVTVAVTGVTVNPTSATLTINSTQQLTATIAPANASNKNVTWGSSNNAVATVSAGGLVTAIAAGTATITVTTQDGNKTATCNVTSTPVTVAVTGVTVNPTSATLTINSTQQLTATIAPANASNKNVTWGSSNNAVATVSAGGLVTAIAAGGATITVTTQDGNKTATCSVTVSQALPGSLTGSGLSSSATVNLSTEGVADWAHWSGYGHKSTGGSKISNYVVVGSGSVLNYANDPRTCTWSDGTPAVSGSNKNGIYIAGTGKGFQVTAPADLTSRTLKVYVGGWISGGTLTAQLSDGSSANYVNSSFSGTGQYDAVYTLTYKAASAGKLLTVKWVQSSGTGNVTLQAATLVENPGALNKTVENSISEIAATGRSNSLSNEALIIYPNPFDDNLFLNYSGKETGRGTIILYNSEMRMIATYPFVKTSWAINKNLAVHGLASGVYFVQFNLGGTKIMKLQVKM